MKTKMVCIMCPMGCEMDVENVNGNITVTGNTCVRGEKYAVAELTEPMRVFTSVIKTTNGVVSVKTDKPIPKKLMDDVVNLVKQVKVDKLSYGDVVIENILNTGANLIVTRDVVL